MALPSSSYLLNQLLLPLVLELLVQHLKQGQVQVFLLP